MKRIVGIDLARGIAILGMFVLHGIPPATPDSFGQSLLSVFDDQRAQILFAVLDGVALGILSSEGPAAGQPLRSLQRRIIAIRGLFLVALGLFLSTLESGIIIILDYYGIYFLLMLPMLYMRVRSLALIGTVFLVAGPLIADLSRNLLDVPSTPTFTLLPPLVDRVASWTLVGQYPAVQWLGYVILGLIICRIGLKARGIQTRYVIAGIGVAVVGYVAAGLLEDRHLANVATLLGSVGCVVATIGVCLVATRGDRGVSRIATNVLSPISALGSMPMSTYSVHVLYFAILGFFYTMGAIRGIQSMETWFFMTVAGLILPFFWTRTLGRGPLERVVRLLLPNRGSITISS